LIEKSNKRTLNVSIRRERVTVKPRSSRFQQTIRTRTRTLKITDANWSAQDCNYTQKRYKYTETKTEADSLSGIRTQVR